MENEGMSKTEFKTVMEMVLMIAENSKDKDEIVERLKNLSILKEDNN